MKDTIKMSSSSTNSQDPSHSHQHQQHAGWTDKTNTPASPTHFLSRASRRLPELQLQLQLNPELNATELLEPTETEPLLSYHSHITHQQASHEPPIHASSSYNQHQSQSCLSTRRQIQIINDYHHHHPHLTISDYLPRN
ncbi:hypothetical protein H4Q26_011625 [Puccinia striiformis f. sp. tritici PST-130]|nr:hypothetical protein H4Q26_011625 [Puccinia striiformis f. sp. tritici PST-130]